MKSASANLDTHIKQDATSTCFLVRIERLDDAVRLFTDHDEPVSIDVGFGAETYQPSGSPMRSAISTSADFGLDDLEATGPTILLDNEALDPDELRDGDYDGAEIRVYECNWKAPADGAILWRRGWLGSVTYSNGRYTAQLTGMMRRLERKIMRKISRDCPVKALGNSLCKVVLDPPVWTALTDFAVGDVRKASAYDGRRQVCSVAGTSGAAEPVWDTTVGNSTVDGTATWVTEQAFTQLAQVDAVTDKRNVTLKAQGANPAVDAPDGYFNFGLAIWTTGDNAGKQKEIKDWTLAGAAMELFEGTPRDIAPDDQLTLIVGCDRQFPTCRDKFDNVENYRGFPFTPTTDDVLETPDAR